MVKGAVTVVLVMPAMAIVLAKVPLPEYTPVMVAWPVIAKPLADRVAVPVKANVLVTLAACTPIQSSSAKAKVENVRFIGLLESSTLNIWECARASHSATTPVPIRRADLKSLPLAGAFVHSE